MLEQWVVAFGLSPRVTRHHLFWHNFNAREIHRVFSPLSSFLNVLFLFSSCIIFYSTHCLGCLFEQYQTSAAVTYGCCMSILGGRGHGLGECDVCNPGWERIGAETLRDFSSRTTGAVCACKSPPFIDSMYANVNGGEPCLLVLHSWVLYLHDSCNICRCWVVKKKNNLHFIRCDRMGKNINWTTLSDHNSMYT